MSKANPEEIFLTSQHLVSTKRLELLKPLNLMAGVPLVLNKFCSKVKVGGNGLKKEHLIRKLVLHSIKKDEICKRTVFYLIWGESGKSIYKFLQVINAFGANFFA